MTLTCCWNIWKTRKLLQLRSIWDTLGPVLPLQLAPSPPCTSVFYSCAILKREKTVSNNRSCKSINIMKPYSKKTFAKFSTKTSNIKYVSLYLGFRQSLNHHSFTSLFSRILTNSKWLDKCEHFWVNFTVHL